MIPVALLFSVSFMILLIRAIDQGAMDLDRTDGRSIFKEVVENDE